MDKHTLSNYGWLVILTLVLSVMIAFATPFGEYVQTGAQSISDAIISANNDAVNENSLKSNNNIWEAKLEHNAVGNVDIYYFPTLEAAVNAINDDNFTSVTTNKQDAVMVLVDNDTLVIKLQKDVTITESIKIQKDCILDLGGHTIKINNKSIVFSQATNIKLCNGNILKNQTESGSNSAISIKKDCVALIDNVNINYNMGVSGNVTIIALESSSYQYVTITNSNLNLYCDANVPNGNDTPYQYAIYMHANTGVVNIENTDIHVEGVRIYCIRGYINSINIKNSKISAKELADVNTENKWTSHTIFAYEATVTIENSTVEFESTYANSTSTINLQNANTIIRNSRIIENVMKDTSDRNFSYALQVAYESTADVYNSDLIVNASCTQTSSIRCQSTGIVNATKCNLIVNFDADCKSRYDGFVGYTLFMNGVGENSMTIKDSYIKGEYGMYGISATNKYIESNNNYDVTERAIY